MSDDDRVLVMGVAERPQALGSRVRDLAFSVQRSQRLRGCAWARRDIGRPWQRMGPRGAVSEAMPPPAIDGSGTLEEMGSEASEPLPQESRRCCARADRCAPLGVGLAWVIRA